MPQVPEGDESWYGREAKKRGLTVPGGDGGPPRQEPPASSWYEDEVRRRVGLFNMTREQGQTVSPDAAARVVRLERRTGLPADLLAANLDAVEAEAARHNFDAERFRRESPVVFDWIASSPWYAGLSRDEVKKLGDLETFLRRPKHLWPKPDALLDKEARAAAKRRAPEAFQAEQLRQEIPSEVPPLPAQFKTHEEAEEAIYQGELAARREEEAFIAAEGPTGVFESLGAVQRNDPFFWVPFLSGVADLGKATRLYNAARAVDAGTATDDDRDLIERFGRMEEATARRGRTMLGTTAGILSQLPAFGVEVAVTGGVGGFGKAAAKEAAEALLKRAVKKTLSFLALKAVQTPAILGPEIGAGTLNRLRAGEPLSKALPKEIVSAWAEIASESAGGLLAKLDQPLNKALFGWWASKHPGATGETFQAALRAAGFHGPVGEFAEERIADLIRGVAGVEPFQWPSLEDATAELLAFTIPHAAGAALSRIGPRKPQETNPEIFRQLGAAAQDLRLRERSPEQLAALVDRIAKDTGNAYVYAPLEAWTTYWQGQKDAAGRPLDPRQVASELLGSPKAYDDAQRTGEDLPIPLARYAVGLAATDHNTFWQNELRSAPTEMNAREMKEEGKRLEREEKEAAKEAEKDEPAVGRVRETVTQGLKDVGFEEGQARAQAELYAAAFRTLGQRAGVDPFELFQRYNVKIARPALAAELGEGERALEQPFGLGGRRLEPPEGRKDLQSLAATHFGSTGDIREAGYVLPDGTFLDLSGRHQAVGFERTLQGFKPKAGEKDYLRGERNIDHRQLGPTITAALRQEAELFGGLTDKMLAFQRQAGAVRVSPGTGISANFIPTHEQIAAIVDAWKRAFPGEAMQVDADFPSGAVSRSELVENPTVDNVLAVFAPEEFEQPSPRGEGEARGRIRIGAGSMSIDLLKNADLSTFLHETGHFYLEVLGDLAEAPTATQDLRADWQTVLDWLGVKSRAEITVEHHEKWARGFEAYLMEGKAPSSGLRAAFARFRAWLVQIYRTVLALGVELRPDVKRVMDRLLATEEEIAAAEAEQAIQSFFPEEHREAIARARESNRERLMGKALEAIRRERLAWYRDEREKVRGELEVVVNGLREFVALANLTRGTLPDGSPLPEGTPAVKLSREAIVERYGEEKLKDLPRRAVAKEGGLHPDAAGELFGFSSGDELLSAIAQPKIDQGSAESDIRQELERLEAERVALEEAQAPLETEAQRAAAEFLAGPEALARKLSEAMKAEERSKVKEFQDILRDIRQRGGVRPTTSTERIPRTLRAGKEGGVGSDELAQEFADRGLIRDALSDDLYDWLEMAAGVIRGARGRVAAVEKEAKRLAKIQSREALQAFTENIRAQERLRGLLENLALERQRLGRAGRVDRRRAMIERLTDEEMRNRYEDLADDPAAIHEEAVRAIHNVDRARVMRLDMERLVSEDFAKFKGLTRKIARKVPKLDAVRADARAVIAGKRVRDIAPGLYQRAEAKASRAALDAFLAGNFERAFDEKGRELLNHELYLAASEAKEEAEAVREYMAKFERASVREALGKAGADYLDRIDDILERFEFRRVSLRRLDRRESFREWFEGEKEKGLAPEIPDRVLDESYRQNYRELPYEELLGIRDAVQSLEHLARFKNRLIKDARKRALDEAVTDAVGSIEEHSKGARAKDIETRLPGTELHRLGAGFFASHRKLSSLLRQMDGFKDGGVLWDLFLRPVNEAADRQVAMKAQAAKDLRALFEVYSARDFADMYRKSHIQEIGASLTKMGQLMVALNWGNADNRRKLMDGRGWTEAQAQAVLRRLDERDWKFVQSVWDYIDTYWPETKALAERTKGIAPEKVESEPVETAFATFRGGYFPLRYDDRLSPKAYSHLAEKAARDAMEGARIRATTRHGHREERVKGVNLPVRLDFGVIFEHLNEVIHDQTHYEMLVDVNRLLGHKRLQTAIIDHYGDIVYGQLREAVKDIAVGDLAAQSSFEKAVNWLRTGTSISAMAWNVTTALVQPLGLTQSVVRVGPKWIARGLGRWLGDASRMESTVKWIHERSDFMRNRARTQMREINEVRNTIGQKSRLAVALDEASEALTGGRLQVTQIADSFFWLITRGQMIADVPTWIGAYEKAMAEAGEPGSAQEREEAEERAARLADQAVLDTQGGGQVKDLASIQRGGPLLKLWTNFYSYFNVTYNLTAESFRRTNFRSPVDIGRLAVDLLMLYSLPAVLGVLLRHLLRGGDDDELPERIVREQASYIIGTMVGFREIGSAVQGYQGYEGPAGTRFFGEFGGLLRQVEQGEADEAFFKALNQSAGILLHYPAGQVQRTAEGFLALTDGDAVSPSAILAGPPRK